MRRVLLAAAIGFAASVSQTSFAIVLTVEVWDWQDGRDYLYLQSNTVQWQHFDYNVPGVEAGHDDPTRISTTLDGAPVMVDYPWYPEWPDGTDWGDFSSMFTGLVPAIPQMDMVFSLEILQARDSVSIIEVPTASNSYRTIVELNDNPSGSAAWYGLRFRYEFVPEPVSLLGIGLGLAGLYLGRRAKR